MKLIIEALALLVIGTIAAILAIFVIGRAGLQLAGGELRCEGAGAVVIKIDGKDYAVNGMASRNYPMVQTIWNESTTPEMNIDRLIARGLTLCDWHTAANK